MQKGFRQSTGFFAKDEVGRDRVADLGTAVPRHSGKAVKCRIWMAVKKVLQTVVIGDVEQVPVVQPCALELFVISGKAERTDEVQGGAGGCACAGDIARILGNFRFVQNNANAVHVIPRKMESVIS